MLIKNDNPQFATPPGEIIRQELEVRGWTQYDLADILGVNQSVISQVVNGKRPISLELARDLGDAFGNDPTYWLTLDTAFRLFTASPSDGLVHRRARLFEAAPVNEMIKRRWIQGADDPDLLEKQILGFYGVSTLDEFIAPIPHAARKSTSSTEVRAAERAWIHRVRKLAMSVSVGKFSAEALGRAKTELRSLLLHPESVRHVPKVLAKAGIRFVIVEPLGRSRIDGICLWLGKTSPVIGLSLRIDRLDSFWFTLFHELAHVENRDALVHPPKPDSDLIGETAIPTDQKPDSEQAADRLAASFLIKPSEIESFIARVAPLFSKSRVQGFAKRIGVHPAIVIGQLHHMGQIEWGYGREFVVKVRDSITPDALTDGWGQTLPAAS